jgi:hypothetical protein
MQLEGGALFYIINAPTTIVSSSSVPLSSSTTLDHGLRWNFPSKIALDIPLHHIASLSANRRRYNMTKRLLSYARAHPKRRVRTIYPAGRPATIIITELAPAGAFRHLTRHC